MDDSEDVMKYLRDVKEVKSIIVHGEGFGGAIACHLAKNSNCDFLFADRSISNMKNLIQTETSSTILSTICNFIINWKIDVPKNFISSSCYKLIGHNINCSGLEEICSLRNGVSNSIISEGKPVSTKTPHMLSENETYVFWRNLKDLSDMIVDFEANTKRAARKLRGERPRSQDFMMGGTPPARKNSDPSLREIVTEFSPDKSPAQGFNLNLKSKEV